MTVDELRLTVATLKELLADAGAKATTVRGLDEFEDLLASRQGQSLDELIADLDSVALTGLPNQLVVQEHLRALNAAGAHREDFQHAFRAMRDDARVGPREADLIFKQYHGRSNWQSIYGDKPRWRKLTEALKAIETSFIERMTQGQKELQVTKATPW